MRIFAVLGLTFFINAVVMAKPFDANVLVKLRRLGSFDVSTQNHVVFELKELDETYSRYTRSLWLIDFTKKNRVRKITSVGDNWAPQFSPDGKYIYFLSNRSNNIAIYRLSLSGGEAEKVLDIGLDITSFKLSPTGKGLLFSADVYPECEDFACTAEKLKSKDRDVYLFRSLPIRHWDRWEDGRRSYLFYKEFDSEKVVSLMKGMKANCPSRPFGGSEEYTFSPDGKVVYFTAKVGGSERMWKTNFDLWKFDIENQKRYRVTNTEGYTGIPLVSADGNKLAYLQMQRGGYESDKKDIVVVNLLDGSKRTITTNWDRSVVEYSFGENGDYFLVTSFDFGNRALFKVFLNGRVEKLVSYGTVRHPIEKGGYIWYSYENFKQPADLYRLFRERLDRLTFLNREVLKGVEFGDVEQFKFKGWNGEDVYSWMVKPVGFDPTKRYPLAYLIHGGPQGSWGNDFHYRWNPQVYAGAGFVTVMVDFHGSVGYGQKFTDSIRGRWGSAPLEDLKKGFRYISKNYSFVDTSKACALGASYGGYMINWIAGNWHVFKCLVNHDGVFDTRSMYYTTEELWFIEWEFKGRPFDYPLDMKNNLYEKFNPANYVKNWRTPMLVVHGELDFRVPIGQGISTFTTLQRLQIESEFLYFPKENHWVLSPKNSLRWHESVLNWIKKWTSR